MTSVSPAIEEADPATPIAEAVEPRLVSETGVAARIATTITPVLEERGFRLVRVMVSGLDGGTVQVMAERPDGSMPIDDCETLSRTLSPLLDAADPIDHAYHLEVSSPGLDRPLVRRSDFARHIGAVLKVELTMPLEGRRRFRGALLGIEGDSARLAADFDPDNPVLLRFDDMADARLVVTDELIAASLRRGKSQLRATRRPGHAPSSRRGAPNSGRTSRPAPTPGITEE